MLDAIKRVGLIASVVVVLTAVGLHAAPPEPYKLDNGLTVILRPVPTAEQVAVVVLFNLGGDHDPPGKSGRAHLLEHLYCTAAAGEAPARNFMQLLKRYPAGSNYQTGRDYTVIAGVANAEQLAAELKDAAARMGALRITDADLKREVPRLLLELRNMYGGMPSLAGMNHVRMRMHPITRGGQPGGTPEHVKAITLDELRKLWHDHYKPGNAILALAGKFDVAEVRKLIKQHFGPIAAGKAPPPKQPRPKAKTGTTHRVKVKPAMRQATGVVSIGYAPPLPGSEDYAPFLVVMSRLFALTPGRFRPGQVPPVFYPVLEGPTTVGLQAPLPAGTDAQAVLKQLDQRLQAALKPKLKPQDKLRTINSMGVYLATAEVPDALWARNLYGLAFSVGRRHQLKIDGKKLREAIQRVTDADMQRLAASVFPAAKRIAVIVEVEK